MWKTLNEGDIFTDRSNRTYDASQASGSTETHQNPDPSRTHIDSNNNNATVNQDPDYSGQPRSGNNQALNLQKNDSGKNIIFQFLLNSNIDCFTDNINSDAHTQGSS
ncbi:hypothetical protein C8R41DRAFT_551563 [Lentinula lateritia]|uniref:Uncharacterized protein n=1 Tax=Lentinula lateritia TaxID=40482 RepID=A0ABQ8V5T0_9AGAR|nr:hypothetical protein C8R41DRAFT_551563 [Lentinula lateritia]